MCILLLMCAAPDLSAQSPEALLRSGETALRHHLYEVAADHFQRASAHGNATEPERWAAWTGLARTRMGTGSLEAVEEILERFPDALEEPWRSQNGLIRAELLFARGDLDAATDLLITLAPLEGAPEVTRLRLLARARHALGKTGEADQILAEALEALPQASGLLLERAELARLREEFDLAVSLWEALLADGMPAPDRQMALVRLCERALQEERIQAARERLDELLALEPLSPLVDKHVYPLVARVLRAEGREAEAATFFQAWEGRVRGNGLSVEARIRRAHALVGAGELEEGRQLLRGLIARQGDHPLLAEAWRALAERYLEAGNLERASETFEEYLSVFTSPSGLRYARLGLAQLREQEERWADAQSLYEQVLLQRADISDMEAGELTLKIADMLFARGEYDAAREQYRALSAQFPEHPLRPQADFMAAMALGRSDKLDEALDELAVLRWRHAHSPVAERALLEQAVLLTRFLQLERAFGTFEAYAQRYPEGEFIVDALTDKGLVAYRMGAFDMALETFDDVLRRFPEHPRAEQAFFLRGWTLYFQGRDEAALQVGREFLERFPDSIHRDDVRFWLAEQAYNRGNPEEALREFQAIANEAATDVTVSRAHYLAGRAAMALGAFDQAVKKFAESFRVLPDAPHASEVLFYHGDALTELNRFDEAIVVFERLLNTFPTSAIALAARGRLGDCHFTLGQQDPGRFLLALDAYRLVEESSGAPPDLRLQAAYKIARTLSALSRQDEALSQYMHVVVRFLDQRALYGTDAEDFFNRAATSAAQIYEQRQDWRRAIQVYRLVVESGLQPAGRAAESRIQNLRREHLIFF